MPRPQRKEINFTKESILSLMQEIYNELVEQRNQYFANKTNSQMEAVDRDMMKDSNPAMPMMKPERRSQVAFGGKKSVD